MLAPVADEDDDTISWLQQLDNVDACSAVY